MQPVSLNFVTIWIFQNIPKKKTILLAEMDAKKENNGLLNSFLYTLQI